MLKLCYYSNKENFLNKQKILVYILLIILAGLIGTFIWFKLYYKRENLSNSVVTNQQPPAKTAVKSEVSTIDDSKNEDINVTGDEYNGQDTSKERQDVTKYNTFSEITQDIDYQNINGPDMKLDLFYPTYKNELNKNGAPLIIYVHGGGWVGGDKTIFDQVGGLVRLIKAGYAVASINYHLAPDFNYPTQLKDIEQAIVFLKHESVKYKLDVSHIGLMASSAGAQLATQFAALNTDPNTKADALVLVAPATDLYSDTWSVGMKKYIKQLMNGQSAAAASPINNITNNLPPIYIIQGEKDATVKPEQTNAYVEKLKSVGKSVELLTVKNAGHDFNSATSIEPSKEEIGQTIVRFMNKYVRLVSS